MGWDTQAPVGLTQSNVASLGTTVKSGTTAQNAAYTGAEGELTLDSTLGILRVHDGSTAGGTAVGTGVGGASAFSGALLQLTGSETITKLVETPIPWDAATYDTDTYWAIGNPTRLTIPADVTYVQLSAGIFWDFAGTAQRAIWFTKNGGDIGDDPGLGRESDFGDNGYQSLNSAVVAVSEGDYFEMLCYTASASNKTLAVHGSNFFSIMKIAGA